MAERITTVLDSEFQTMQGRKQRESLDASIFFRTFAPFSGMRGLEKLLIFIYIIVYDRQERRKKVS